MEISIEIKHNIHHPKEKLLKKWYNVPDKRTITSAREAEEVGNELAIFFHNLKDEEPDIDEIKEYFKDNLPEERKEEIAEKTTEIIAKEFELKNVPLTANFNEDLNLDSLDLVELAMAIEEEFKIEVPDEDFIDLETVEDLIDLIILKMYEIYNG